MRPSFTRIVVFAALGTACGGAPSPSSGAAPVATSVATVHPVEPAPAATATSTAAADGGAAAPKGEATRALVLPPAPGLFRDGCVKTGAVAFDATNVYWATESSVRINGEDSNAVWTAPRTGGAPRRLMTLRGAASLAVDDTHVFVAQQFDDAPKDGGPHYISWVAKVPKAGGDPAMLFTKRTNPAEVRVDANRIYWTEGKSVRAARKDATEEVSLHPRKTGSLVADGDAIYFSDWGSSAAQVVRIAKTAKGVGSKKVVLSGVLEIQALALDATHVYALGWAEAAPKAGVLVRAPKAGGAMQTLARGLPYVRTIAVDDTRVYLSDEKNILTVPKLPANKPEAPAQWAAPGSVVHLAVDRGALFWTGALTRSPDAPPCVDPFSPKARLEEAGPLGWAAVGAH